MGLSAAEAGGLMINDAHLEGDRKVRETVPERVTSLYVLGGEQRHPRSLGDVGKEWNGYRCGRIVQVDVATGSAVERAIYVSPREVCADEDPEILFQAGTLQGNRLYTCTGTEVLAYSLPEFERIRYISLPCFNDVHHVTPGPGDDLLVANAGLEMVMQLSPDGGVRRVWNVLGEDPWARFSRTTDYRKIGSTKPHRSHPNFVFRLGDEVWATRFQQGDAVSLTNPPRRIHVSTERIHDGLVHDGKIYFTTVHGKVVVANAASLAVEETIDLTRMHPEGLLLGWCRGILIDGDRLWVGFSRIRPTKVRENVTWVARGFRATYGTHIACYDLSRGVCLQDIDLESAGLNAVFGIFPAIPVPPG
jgi:hypothetical protein